MPLGVKAQIALELPLPEQLVRRSAFDVIGESGMPYYRPSDLGSIPGVPGR
jgi:hypothetical protein